MSAYVCQPEHIGLLAAYAASDSCGAAKQIAKLLAEENIRSVATRYPDDLDGQRPGPCLRDSDIVEAACLWAKHYVLNRKSIPSPLTIIKLCNCLEYQSSETDDWAMTDACAQLESITSKALRALPGYDSAPWEWVEEKTPAALEAFYESLEATA